MTEELDLTGYRQCDIGTVEMSDTRMGKLIRSTFEQSGLSIKRLAKLAGLGYATTHGVIRGNIDPTLTTLERLCEALDLELRPKRRGARKTKVR